MSILQDNPPARFIIHEHEMSYSRDAVIVAPRQDIAAGMVLGKRPAGSVVVGVPVKTATGGGAMTLADPPYGDGVAEGVYVVKCTTASAGGGTFTIYLPDGSTEATVAVGAAYDGTVKFTIADGAPDFDEDDQFTILVEIADAEFGEYSAYDPGGTDGSEAVSGVAIYGLTTGDFERKKTAAVVRGPATVNPALLVWHEGATEQEITAGIVALMALKIRAR